MSEVAAGGAGGSKVLRSDVLEAKLGDCFGGGAGESRRLRDRREVVKAASALGSINDARSEGFDAQAADGYERLPTQRLRGEVDGELRESESVDALTAGGESQENEFVCGGASGGENDDLKRTRACREECGGAGQKLVVRAGADNGARDHEQLY